MKKLITRNTSIWRNSIRVCILLGACLLVEIGQTEEIKRIEKKVSLEMTSEMADGVLQMIEDYDETQRKKSQLEEVNKWNARYYLCGIRGVSMRDCDKEWESEDKSAQK